ncbi:uncharacterized protein PV06_03957 [Exophiala oligosperma]|uniref:Zn(2)-C6 fungal-type domain-containing protein n=1 Tax=Exophiala oligosperma TaxID=215243 RepID=A0A0D2B0H4_9EURO|nr:uncharacterized protein PV06_03957 [Exophiala oligosperma]KIW45576.1 hypothetical protein PV06_03957 [Exophiala oligosperma]
MSANSEPVPVERKKTSAPKVRTGCITCKKRHVKCDEARPVCLRCRRGGHKCLGYDTIRTWMFEPARSSVTQSHPQPAPERKDEWSSLSGEAENALCPPSSGLAPLSLFSSLSETRSFEFFLHNTGPFLSHFSPTPAPLFNAFIRSALSCAATKNLLLALAILDESRIPDFALRKTGSAPLKAAERYHTAALGLMARERYPLHDLLIASILAWSYEVGNRRMQSARVHLDSALLIADKNLARSSQDSDPSYHRDDLVETVLKPSLDANQSFHHSTTIFANQGATGETSHPSLDLPGTFSSVSEAAQLLEGCFDLLYVDRISTSDAAAFGRNWLDIIRRHRTRGIGIEPLMQRWVLYLLYATLGTFIEVKLEALSEFDAQTRCNHVIGLMETISETELFAGFSDALGLIMKITAGTCQAVQPVVRIKRLLDKIRGRGP